MQGIGLSCIHINNHIQRQRIKIEIKRVEKKLAGSILMAIVSVILLPRVSVNTLVQVVKRVSSTR